MKDLGWEVQYVSWSDYREAIITGEGETWQNLQKGDLVFGGMEISCIFHLSSFFEVETNFQSLLGTPIRDMK